MEKKTKIINCEHDFVHHIIVSAVKGAGSISVGVSDTVLRGSWCNIIVLNVRAPSGVMIHKTVL
jgi:hypothetical protein